RDRARGFALGTRLRPEARHRELGQPAREQLGHAPQLRPAVERLRPSLSGAHAAEGCAVARALPHRALPRADRRRPAVGARPARRGLMAAFLVRRLLSGLLLIALLTFLTFVVFNEIPTNPACLVVACGPHTSTTDEQIREADHTLGIDRSVFVQYGDFVWKLVRHRDFGKAWTRNEQVGTLIGDALPATASLVVGGMALMLLLALP